MDDGLATLLMVIGFYLLIFDHHPLIGFLLICVGLGVIK